MPNNPNPKDQYVKVGDINTRYWQVGTKGSAIVLIHGFAASVEDWALNVNALAKNHRVYALDLVGFGRSDKPDIKYNGSLLAKFIKDFMHTQNLDKAIIMGHSLGGAIALHFTIEYQDMVDKLILVGSGGFDKKVTFNLRLLSAPVIGDIIMHFLNRKLLTKFMRQMAYHQDVISEQLIEPFVQIFQLPGTKKSMLAISRGHMNIFGVKADALKLILANLANIKVPTLLVWGKQDPVVPIAHANFAMQHLPNAELHVFDQCGHLPQMEYPEQFNKLITDFIKNK